MSMFYVISSEQHNIMAYKQKKKTVFFLMSLCHYVDSVNQLSLNIYLTISSIKNSELGPHSG